MAFTVTTGSAHHLGTETHLTKAELIMHVSITARFTAKTSSRRMQNLDRIWMNGWLVVMFMNHGGDVRSASNVCEPAMPMISVIRKIVMLSVNQSGLRQGRKDLGSLEAESNRQEV
jgi:hypothetical protein